MLGCPDGFVNSSVTVARSRGPNWPSEPTSTSTYGLPVGATQAVVPVAFIEETFAHGRALNAFPVCYRRHMEPTGTEHVDVEYSAFAPDKPAWKDAGNRFTADELRAMEEHGADIVLIEPEEPVYRAD